MSKPTPGPWRALGSLVIATNDRALGEAHQTLSIASADEVAANARLMAAAPELLAALERVGCQDRGSCGPGEIDGRCFVCAAIAKARGGK